MDLDDHLDLIEGPTNCFPTPSNGSYRLPNLCSRELTLAEQMSLGKLPDVSANSGCVLPASSDKKVNAQAGSVISKIEDILEQVLDCVIDEKKELVLCLKPRVRSGRKFPNTGSGAIKICSAKEARTVRFPGRTAQEAWKFTVLLRILELSHQALVTGVVTTKRDIYYQDPELFLKQSVVDRYVDDIASNFDVKREALNIVAAAKGLVAGYLAIVKNDKSVIDCRIGNEGVLVPSLDEIDCIDMRGARWALVIEKEATFRSLVASRFWEKSLAGRGILVTGKGYPDIQTRGFVRLLSTCNRLAARECGSSYIKVFALMDFDPDGLAIMSTYKHGSASLTHENDTLVAPTIEWVGINSNVITVVHIDRSRTWLYLSPRDRKMATKMLEKPVYQEEVEASWRRELQVMLFLNIKAEIQILGEHSNLEDYLSSELQSHMYPI